MSTSKIDVEPTAAGIEEAARRLRQAADELDRVATRMREKQDLSYAAEAVSTLVNVPQLARIDLLVTRPLRALGHG